MDANKACVSAAAEVRAFCESVSGSTSSSISLLRAIEQTVEWLTLIQDRAKADSAFAYKAADHLKSCTPSNPIDSDGVLSAKMEEIEESLQKLHGMLVAKQNVAVNAPELDGDNRDSVLDEYTAAISAIADLHNSIADLKWAIGEHDADLEKPSGEVFTERDKLKAYLASI